MQERGQSLLLWLQRLMLAPQRPAVSISSCSVGRGRSPPNNKHWATMYNTYPQGRTPSHKHGDGTEVGSQPHPVINFFCLRRVQNQNLYHPSEPQPLTLTRLLSSSWFLVYFCVIAILFYINILLIFCSQREREAKRCHDNHPALFLPDL